MTIENCQLPESKEYNKEQCDNKTDKLEQKIALDFPFEKNTNSTYSIIKDNIKLDIEITSDNLIEANKKILQLLTYFKQESNSSSHFYIDEFFDKSIDMKQSLFSTEFLEDKKFQNLFWWEENKQKLINFLHLILWVTESEWDFSYNKSYAAPDYIDLVDMNENEKLISSIQEKYDRFQNENQWKNIEEIKKSFWEVTRESSLLLALFIIKNPIIVNQWSIGISTMGSITYNNMRYSWKGLEQSVTWSNMRCKYKWWAFIELQQHSRIRGKLQLIDHTDQIILNQLLWNTTSDDYKIPRTSSSKYEWIRYIQK